MTMFLIQSAILLAIAFIIGAIIGCLLKRMFASEDVTVPVTTAAVATTAAAAAATTFIPKAEPAPVAVPKPETLPEPVAAPAVAAPVMTKVAATAAPKKKAAAKPKVAKPKPVRASVKDDLKLIVGIGPINESKLNAHGVATFAQIAGWKKPDIIEAEKYLEFDGRIEREQWVRQAKKLALGGSSEDAAELARQGKGSKAKTAVSAKPSAAKPVAAKSATVNTAAKAKAASVGLMDTGGTKAAKSAVNKQTVKAEMVAKSAAPKPIKTPAAKTAAPSKKPLAAKLDKPFGGKPDNLTLINGIGNVIEKKLHGMGVFHFEQIANWTEQMAEDFSKAVGFPGRAKREGWMKEAALFAKGGTTEHARKVEAGAIPTSRKSTAAEKGKK